MRLSHFTAATLIATLHLVVPLALILWTWGRSYSSHTALVLQVLVLVAYIAFIFLMGAWVYASFYLRYTILILALAAVIRSFFHLRALPVARTPHLTGWAGYGAAVIVTVVLVYFIVGSIRSRFYDGSPVELVFPFKNGAYAVFEGGNGRASFLMNYHYGASMHQGARTNLSMKYAVDITKLTR
jgi:hypothetical protein